MSIRDTIKRIAKDVKELTNCPLHDNGIYYKHDDDDLLKGYAMIYGPENTPYEYGYYFFEFNFPKDYPFTPPTLVFCTNADRIRMNPNLYRCGKVCISILNTWKGEQWSSCQTIKSILLSLLTIFNDKPLLNEPGFTESHIDFDKYNKIIDYKNIDIAIYKTLKFDLFEKYSCQFEKNILIDRFKNNYDNIIKKIQNNKRFVNKIITTETYNMSVNIDYNTLCKNIKELYNNLK